MGLDEKSNILNLLVFYFSSLISSIPNNRYFQRKNNHTTNSNNQPSTMWNQPCMAHNLGQFTIDNTLSCNLWETRYSGNKKAKYANNHLLTDTTGSFFESQVFMDSKECFHDTSQSASQTKKLTNIYMRVIQQQRKQ